MSRGTTHHYQRGCAGKVAFATLEEAEAERRWQLEYYGNRRYVYQCVWSRHYHLTTQPQRRQARAV